LWPVSHLFFVTRVATEAKAKPNKKEKAKKQNKQNK